MNQVFQLTTDAVAASTDDYYAALAADAQAYQVAQRRIRPLGEVLAEDVADYNPGRFDARLPSGRLIGVGPGPLGILVRRVIKPAVRERSADYYFDLEGDHLLMSRAQRPQQVVPVEFRLRSIVIGAGLNVGAKIIVRDAADAGMLLTQGVIDVADAYFRRGRRF